jgi:hypothetical protein
MKKKCVCDRECKRKISAAAAAAVATGGVQLLSLKARAQQGSAGITNATDQVKQYFAIGIDLMYAIGAIVGIIGAVKVYNKWNAGDNDATKVASAWFGSCIFLVVVATILKGFFNV